MNGDRLLEQIRRRLRDFEDVNKQGTFWDDFIIRLILNQAQLVLVNYLVLTKKHNLLTHLVRHEMVTVQGAFSLSRLQNEFLAPISVGLRDPNNQTSWFRPAKIYVAGDTGAFMQVDHYAAFFFNDRVMCRDDQGFNELQMQLTYYTYPPLIAIRGYRDENNILDDNREEYIKDTRGFDEWIYYDMILPLAMIMLGVKDTVNQRDNKILKEYVDLNKLFVSLPVFYVKNNDNVNIG